MDFKRNFFDRFVKTAFLISSRKIWWNIYLQKINFSPFSGFEQQYFGSYAKVFSHICQNCLLCGQRNVLRERTLAWNKSFNHFWTLNEYARDFCLKFLRLLWLSGLHSMCPKEHFELEKDLSIFSGGWSKKFQSTGGKFSKNLSKRHCARPGKHFGGVFLKKSLIILLHIKQKSYAVSSNFSGTISKTAFINSSRTFQKS